jgi:hypothetical protein
MIEVSASGRDLIEAAKALKETIAERLEVVGNKLGLTADQRAEIRTAHDAFADKFNAQRDRRKALRQEELKALGEILPPEQRDKAKEFVEDHSEQL